MGRIKLDQMDVETIKDLCLTTPLIDREIAEIFGVSRKHINSIRNGSRWNYDYGTETRESQKRAIVNYVDRRRTYLRGQRTM